MKVLILHGIMGMAGENWGQWLADELSRSGYQVIMPTLPLASHPKRSEWLEAIKQNVTGSTQDLIIVAHSLGVTSALDYIEASPAKVKGLVSVSGFARDYGLPLNSYFLQQKTIDFEKVNRQLDYAVVLYGDNDPYVPQAELAYVAAQLKVEPFIVPGGGHLNAAAGFTEFPELLQAVTMAAYDERS